MAVIKILPRDILETRATETLREIVRYDVCDLNGDFHMERSAHVAELFSIQQEVEDLGLDWQDFSALLVDKIEICESERE